MAVVLTGGTGLVGSAVLRALVSAGHEVSAIVRSDSSAATVQQAGATPLVGDLTDRDWLAAQVRDAQGFIHTASPGDASSGDFDRAVVETVVDAFAGSGKPFVHTGGCWVYGSGTDLTEQTPFDAPALTAWRADVEQLVLDADGVRGVVIAPGIVYNRGAAGTGGGLGAMLAAPDEFGDFRLIGDGSQHWTTVSNDELADLYVRAFTDDAATDYYLGVSDEHPTVRDIAEAAAATAGRGQVVPETVEESRARVSAMLADALLLDQVASNAKARSELGWDPVGTGLLDEVRSGAYVFGS